MAFDTYLLIGDGTKNPTGAGGEATASGLTPATGWIAIYSFSWGASNPTTVSSGSTGLSAGKVSVSSFNIMKKTENSSCDLFQACCTGQHYATAKWSCARPRARPASRPTFLQYDFTDVMVESVQWSGSSGGDDTPTESVSFAFAKVKISYSKQDEKTGAATPANNASWDATAVGPQLRDRGARGRPSDRTGVGRPSSLGDDAHSRSGRHSRIEGRVRSPGTLS